MVSGLFSWRCCPFSRCRCVSTFCPVCLSLGELSSLLPMVWQTADMDIDRLGCLILTSLVTRLGD